MTDRRRPRVGFVGIHARGRPGQAVSQNEVLAQRFAEDGYAVRMASAIRRPTVRTLHHVVALVSWWRRVDLAVVAVFSGPSFFMAEVALAINRLAGTGTVLFLHGGNLPRFAERWPRRVDRALRAADVVVAPSEFLAGTFRSRGHDVRVIPNLVDIDAAAFRRRDDPQPRLLWMRTFHEHYDPDTAVDVLRLVRERHPQARMTMGGADHGLLAAVKARAANKGLHDAIAFPGYLDTVAKHRAFDEHDVFLNTNVVDNFPVSVVEACASGLLVVATAVGGVPFLLTDGVDALLVPPGDAPAMAAAVCRLLDEPETSASLSAAAGALAEKSRWPSVRVAWESVFDEVMRRRRR